MERVVHSGTTGTAGVRRRRRPVGAGAFGGMVTFFVWLSFAFMADALSFEVLFVALTQALLVGMVIAVWTSSPEWRDPNVGPGVLSALAAHVLMMYTVMNIGPVLFPTGAFFTNSAPVISYAKATLAALSLFVGATLGIRLVLSLSRKRRALVAGSISSARRFDWLPSARVAGFCWGSAMILLVYATFKYAPLWGVRIQTGEVASLALPSYDQVILSALLMAPPLAPLLAAMLVCCASNTKARRHAIVVLVFTILIALACLALWRMRVWAILSIVFPGLLLATFGLVRWRTAFIVGLVACVLAYSLTTQVRTSELVTLFSEQPSLVSLDYGKALRAILKRRTTHLNIWGYFLADLSYNRAGLDAVAAVLEGQSSGWSSPRWGEVSVTEFLSHLPAIIKPESATAQTAEQFGIAVGALLPVDQVETILLGLVLDFGSFLLLFPAILFGIAIALIDKWLWSLAMKPGWEWVKIARLVWLLQIMFANSVAWILVLTPKASIGLLPLLWGSTWIGRIVGTRGRLVEGSRPSQLTH